MRGEDEVRVKIGGKEICKKRLHQKNRWLCDEKWEKLILIKKREENSGKQTDTIQVLFIVFFISSSIHLKIIFSFLTIWKSLLKVSDDAAAAVDSLFLTSFLYGTISLIIFLNLSPIIVIIIVLLSFFHSSPSHFMILSPLVSFFWDPQKILLLGFGIWDETMVSLTLFSSLFFILFLYFSFFWCLFSDAAAVESVKIPQDEEDHWERLSLNEEISPLNVVFYSWM